tara:strand:- start:232 stop:366 length:135 start_codon:yes stop_codon:yes gene_type:complete
VITLFGRFPVPEFVEYLFPAASQLVNPSAAVVPTEFEEVPSKEE